MDHSAHTTAPSGAPGLLSLFDSSAFMPHGHCYFWRPEILWLHVASDLFIALSYFSIPLLIFKFVRRRPDLRLRWLYLGFAVFIFSCGTGHLIDVVTVWKPYYFLEGIVKAITAIASVATAFGTWKLVPHLSRIPNPAAHESTSRQLREMYRRYHLVVEGSNVGIYEWPAIQDDDTAYWSPKLYEWFGLDPLTFKPTMRAFFNRIHPDDIGIVMTFAEELLGGRRLVPSPHLTEFRLRWSDDSYRWVKASGTVLQDKSGRPLKMAGSIEDIHEAKLAEIELRNSQIDLERKVSERTADLERAVIRLSDEIRERRRIESELARAKEAAEKASTEKSRFLANVSHEIRTPLGLVTGFAQLLLDEPRLPAEAREYSEVILRNGGLLSSIIGDILDISKIEAGKIELTHEAVSTDDLLADLRELFGRQCEAKGLVLSVQRAGVVEPTILTDVTRLKQVLINLIGNAIKFTHHGGITVTLSQTDECLVFTITDTGKGIHREKQESVFKPFVQEDTSIQRAFGGTGLGLHLSRALARALGGDVRLVRSELGQGSEFELKIPRKVASVPENRGLKVQAPRSEAPRLFGLRILVVDDVADNLNLVRLLLAKTGATVFLSAKPREALDLALNGSFDLILLDIQMPDLDGFSFLRALRERGQTTQTWALTAMSLK